MKPKISNYKDLFAWQFADELADLVDDLTASGEAARNQRFREQILASSSKAPAQIAEGFLRFRTRESAYYYRVARASLGETMNHLRRGFHRKYWSEPDYARAWKLADSAMKTTGGLLASKLAQIRKDEQEKETRRQARTRAVADRVVQQRAKRASGRTVP
jgi:four helix bundle protein